VLHVQHHVLVVSTALRLRMVHGTRALPFGNRLGVLRWFV
jgi:hypothetical protein